VLNREALKFVINRYKAQYLLLIYIVKVLILGSFSSGYQTSLFMPFIQWFIGNAGNPWQAIMDGRLVAEFPYSTIMLYILAFFNYIADVVGSQYYFISNLIYSLPLLLADLLVLYCLVKLTQYNKIRVAYLYVLSPIILFSTFIHHQLDVIPISIFLFSLLFFIRRQYLKSALILGLSLAAKLNIVLALPLLVIYLIKHKEWKAAIFYPILAVLCFLVTAIPYIYSDAYMSLVIFNSKQQMLFESKYIIGNVQLFLPIFVSLILYAYFLSFNKVNKDLLITFISLLFITNIFFVTPSPGWYVWLLPFVTLSIAKSNSKLIVGYLTLGVLNFLYICYFIFAYKYDYSPILIFGNKIALFSVDDPILSGVIFTFLEAALICTALCVYKFSIKSNNLYRRKSPFCIGVGGDSGTGKSTLKLLMGNLFKDSLLQIEGDGDHRWGRGDKNWDDHTHLNPKANWLHRQSETLVNLKSWKEAKRVDYDHHSGSFTELYSLKPKDVILISGLHPFYLPISRKALDLKVYMEPEETLRRYWKVQRDMAQRGYTLEKIMEQIESRMSDAKKYIYPQKKFSDLIISFFSVYDIEDYSKRNELEIGLRITCEASIPLEEVLQNLNVKVSWDYAEDLTTQVVELYTPPEGVDFGELANLVVPNIDELIYEAKFDNGYNGFIQLITLLSISQKMKGGHQS